MTSNLKQLIEQKLNRVEISEKLSYYSDFYKDIFGFRPMLKKPMVHITVAEVDEMIAFLHAHMDNMKKTEAGRQELIEQGWVLDI